MFDTHLQVLPDRAPGHAVESRQERDVRFVMSWKTCVTDTSLGIGCLRPREGIPPLEVGSIPLELCREPLYLRVASLKLGTGCVAKPLPVSSRLLVPFCGAIMAASGLPMPLSAIGCHANRLRTR